MLTLVENRKGKAMHTSRVATKKPRSEKKKAPKSQHRFSADRFTRPGRQLFFIFVGTGSEEERRVLEAMKEAG